MTYRDLLADRRWRRAAIAVAVVALLALVALSMFPWGWLKPQLERSLTQQVGRPVTIGALHREGVFSFTPTIVVRDVRVPQPSWAGTGDLARIGRGRFRINAFSALFGHVSPSRVAIDGLRLALVRDANGRKNWSSGAGGSAARGGLGRLTLHDARISYRDLVQNKSFLIDATVDPAHGLVATGKGRVRGQPVTLSAKGAPIVDAGARWPFSATIAGDAVGMTMTGSMAHPLDTAHLTADMTAHAINLKLIDAIIEAGLFGTQPVKLAAHAVHDGQDWTVTGLKGTIGQSDLTGHVTSRKVDGRTKLDGAVAFGRLDFDDLAADDGLILARAVEQREGPRLVPDVRINLAHVGDTDGTIAVSARRLVNPRHASSMAWLKGTLTLDHHKLTLAPFTIGLTQGRIGGRIVVDQHDGGPVPIVTIALDLTDSSIPALVGGGGEVSGTVTGRLRAKGSGSTFREVMGNADGHAGLVARNGSLPAKIASELGFDAARALTTGDDQRAGLRCIAIGLDLRRGTGTIDPMVIDTTRAQSRGAGRIVFPGEQVAVRITGAPKAKSVLRLPGALIVSGTIQQPVVHTEKGTKSFGNILKAIGQSIVGTQAPRATDADCAALARQALGGA
ncbi:MAG: AsmA family protein [Sphingomonas sp.]